MLIFFIKKRKEWEDENLCIHILWLEIKGTIVCMRHVLVSIMIWKVYIKLDGR